MRVKRFKVGIKTLPKLNDKELEEYKKECDKNLKKRRGIIHWLELNGELDTANDIGFNKSPNLQMYYNYHILKMIKCK